MKGFPLFVGKNLKNFENHLSNKNSQINMRDGRIPSLLTIKNGKYKGNIIAAIDKASCGADWGFIEIGIRISTDSGETFSQINTVFSPPVREYPFYEKNFTSAFAIDPVLIEAQDGKIILLVDFYPESKGLHAPKYIEKGCGYTVDDKNCKLNIFTGKSKLDGGFFNSGKVFTLHDDGFIYDNNNIKTKYYIPKRHSSAFAYSTIGDVYYCVGNNPEYLEVEPPLIPEFTKNGDIYVGNIYLSGNKKIFDDNAPSFVQKKTVLDENGQFLCVKTEPAPFSASIMPYIFVLESNDGGKTFTQPKDITPYYKRKSDGLFVGVGPGVGITLKSGECKGRMLAAAYKLNKAMVLISDDNGKNWHRNTGKFCKNTDECQLIEMPDGLVFCFGRPKGGGKIPCSVSYDCGENFKKLPPINIIVPQCQKSVITLPNSFNLPDNLKNDGRYFLISTPTGHNGKDKTRTCGKVFLCRIDGINISVVKKYDITEFFDYNDFNKYSDFFAYSCLSVINDDEIGILFEAYPSGFIVFAKFYLD